MALRYCRLFWLVWEGGVARHPDCIPSAVRVPFSRPQALLPCNCIGSAVPQPVSSATKLFASVSAVYSLQCEDDGRCACCPKGWAFACNYCYLQYESVK